MISDYAGCGSRQLCPTSPQAEHGTKWHVGRLICTVSKTWTLWNATIGWKILETSPGTPGPCTWNSSGDGPGHQTVPWSASYPKMNRSFVTGPKYLNILKFCQWNYNDPVLGWLAEKHFVFQKLSFNFFLVFIFPNYQQKACIAFIKEDLIYKKLFSFSKPDKMQATLAFREYLLG